MTAGQEFVTRDELMEDLSRLGVRAGDMVLVHAAVSKVGQILGGPDTMIAALRETVGAAGTIAAYTDWDASYEALLLPDGTVPDAWRDHIPPFDPATSRAVRDNGIFPEFLRTMPGAVRSGSPGASMTAIGAKAEWLLANHPLDYGYGPGSPFAKLVEAGGKVLMLGAPPDTMTLLHHAEHLADIPGKRIKRVEVPFASPSGTEWRWVEEFDTGDAVAPQLDGRDYFSEIVEELLAAGFGSRGKVGKAGCILVDAADVVPFAVEWIERHGRQAQP